MEGCGVQGPAGATGEPALKMVLSQNKGKENKERLERRYQKRLQVAPVQLPKSQERFFSNPPPALGECLL